LVFENSEFEFIKKSLFDLYKYKSILSDFPGTIGQDAIAFNEFPA
jgi:hypothetical protein